MDAYLERIDAADNCLRFYSFELFRNLFGDCQLDRGWGRIGLPGTVASSIHPDPEDALNCAHGILALKVSRGYEVRSLSWERSNVTGMVPRTERGILNLKLCAYFAGHKGFQDMALRMYRHNILYMGEFVQLGSEDISLFMPKSSGQTTAYFDELRERMTELAALLAECNLAMGSKVAGWVRPDGEKIVPLLIGQGLRRRRSGGDARPVAMIYRPDFGSREHRLQRVTRLIG